MRKRIDLDRSKLLGFRICQEPVKGQAPAPMVGKIGKPVTLQSKVGKFVSIRIGSKVGVKNA